jgi:MFS family permease
VVATSAGSVLNPVNSSIIAVALVAIGRSFGVGAASTTWPVSALYLAAAVGQLTLMHPCANPLTARPKRQADITRPRPAARTGENRRDRNRFAPSPRLRRALPWTPARPRRRIMKHSHREGRPGDRPASSTA